MLQIFAIYFAIPTLTGVNLDRMNATILAFSINYAAYFAEIFRGGIQSIPVGQHEASQVLGMTRGQTFFHIVLPQVMKRVLLPISNEVITLVKDTSLANVIAVAELFRAAKNEASRTRVGRTSVCRRAFLSADERRGFAGIQLSQPPHGVL